MLDFIKDRIFGNKKSTIKGIAGAASILIGFFGLSIPAEVLVPIFGGIIAIVGMIKKD